LVVLLVVSGLAVSAAGIGALVDSTESSSPPAQLDSANAPDPPTVEPPGFDSGEDGGGTTPTTETPGTQTTTPTTSTPTSTAVPNWVRVQLSAGDPSDVVNEAGRVRELDGRVSGRVGWDVAGQRTLTVVVHTWDPEYGWFEAKRVTRAVDGDGSLTLEELLGSQRLSYAVGARARAFSNPNEGTTRVRRGYVSVTAFVSTEDGVRRDSAMDEFSFSVTNLQSTIQSSEPNLSVSSPGLLSAGGVAPGQSGSGEAVVANDGDAPGDLDVVLESIESQESDLIEPERGVDAPGNGGELAGNLSVRVYVVADSGERTYAAGGPDSFVPLASLDTGVLLENYRLDAGESVRVRAEWRVASSTGNAIQSDAVAVNVSYVLTST
ncbi:MAG: hypothetical protein ABEJ90_00390, partial [Halobacterium sp.]